MKLLIGFFMYIVFAARKLFTREVDNMTYRVPVYHLSIILGEFPIGVLVGELGLMILQLHSYQHANNPINSALAHACPLPPRKIYTHP